MRDAGPDLGISDEDLRRWIVEGTLMRIERPEYAPIADNMIDFAGRELLRRSPPGAPPPRAARP